MNLVFTLLALALATATCANPQEVREAIVPNTAVYLVDHKGFQKPRTTSCGNWAPTPLVHLVLAEHAIWISTEIPGHDLEDRGRQDLDAEIWRFPKIDSQHDWAAVRAQLSSVREALGLKLTSENIGFGRHGAVVVELAAEDRVAYDQLLLAATLTQEAGFPRVSFVDIRHDTPSYLRE